MNNVYKKFSNFRPQGYHLDWLARRVTHIPGRYEKFVFRYDGHQFSILLDKMHFPIQNYKFTVILNNTEQSINTASSCMR